MSRKWNIFATINYMEVCVITYPVWYCLAFVSYFARTHSLTRIYLFSIYMSLWIKNKQKINPDCYHDRIVSVHYHFIFPSKNRRYVIISEMSHKTSYREILQSPEGSRSGVKILVSLRNLASVAVLLRRLPKYWSLASEALQHLTMIRRLRYWPRSQVVSI